MRRLERTEAAMEMIYIADPMCSWCYGFHPAISAFAERFAAELPLRLMMGGLRAGNREAMGAADKDYVRQAWARVGAATGQPFDMSFFAREDFTYDTEPACRCRGERAAHAANACPAVHGAGPAGVLCREP
jgi:putative protein-disulfide isomerase